MTPFEKINKAVTSGDTLMSALAYLQAGLCPIPVAAKGKKPTLKKWPNHTASEQDCREWFATGEATNLGISCGPSRLVVLDFDTGEAYRTWRARWPDVRTWSVARDNAEKGRCHLYFKLREEDIPPLSTRIADIDVQSTGKQIVAPPSIHVTGAPYQIVDDTPPIEWCNEYHPEFIMNIVDTSNKRGVTTLTMPTMFKGGYPDAVLPTKQGQRNLCLRKLVRWLKFDCALNDKSFDELRPYVQEWHQKVRHVIKTQPFAETWTEFIALWPGAHTSLLSPLIVQALRHAETEPPKCLPEWYDTVFHRRVFSVCWWLATTKECHFFLSCHTLQALTGDAPSSVHRVLKTMQGDGYIVESEKGSRRTRRATWFRWKGHCKNKPVRCPLLVYADSIVEMAQK